MIMRIKSPLNIPPHERAKLISDDIDGTVPLTKDMRHALLLDVKTRQSSKKTAVLDEDVPETVESTLATASDIGQAEEELAAHATSHLEGGLESLGHIGALFANVFSLIRTPWICYKESRWPNRDEWIKISLCVTAIIFVSFAAAFPMIAAIFAVIIATIGVLKGVQNILMQQNELRRYEQQALALYQQIEQLIKEIDIFTLQTKLTEEQQQDLTVKTEQLTRLTDQFVKDGARIHHLKEVLQHPFKALPKQIGVAMSTVAVIGTVLCLFFPLAGLSLLVGAGVISLLTIMTSAIAQRIARHYKPQPVTSDPNMHLDSTAIEICHLNMNHPTVADVDEPLPPKQSAPVIHQEPKSSHLEASKHAHAEKEIEEKEENHDDEHLNKMD